MAHIADFLVDTNFSVGLNNYIARELSPHLFQDVSPKTTPTEEKEKYAWRMHQPTESRKYQLFPIKDKLSIIAGRKSPDPERVFSLAMGQHGPVEKEKSLLGQALRLNSKEQILIRRRKVSVPELGPMTTVQEIAMDSPTIPGRPPLHERSTSAPGNTWRQHVFGESILSCISGPALNENAEINQLEPKTPTHGQASPNDQNDRKRAGTSPTRQLLTPKNLAPLVIPPSSTPQPKLSHQTSDDRLDCESTPPDVPPKSARMMEGSSQPRAPPYTPYTPTPNSTSTFVLSTAPTSVANTPLSAQPNSAPAGRSSPKPWNGGPGTNFMTHTRGQSETTQPAGHTFGHQRHESEGGQSVMDRGRPKKRADGSPLKRSLSIRTATNVEEQKAFEMLPQGIRATDASRLLPAHDIKALRGQAIGQASKFRVLSPKDVDNLSRELHGLDERCEYLRKTHRSLRSGRRNLHNRLCTYLRSPRVARFSHESLLKQEEALSELDSSIDGWVSKLEQAENRRIRVRQKLLEHVAAALIMEPKSASEDVGTGGHETKSTLEMDTPPCSPTKSHSPQRLAAPVQVSSPEPMSRESVESIRIYADWDISALLKEVEEEITRIGEENQRQVEMSTPTPPPVQDEDKKRKVDQSSAIAAGITLNAVAFQPHKPEFA